MNSFKIISVESRKGGVGKSTIALNLASILGKINKYNVLLIDVDITGTSIDGFTKSPLWKSEFNAVKIRDNKNKDQDVNLLAYYKNSFLTGTHRIEFISSKNPSSDKFILCEDKINYIKSELYEKDDFSVICDPRLLFDELHSFWLTRLLDEICKAFNNFSIHMDKKKEAVIILDNSPGYVGLGSAIHEWLTDVGPQRAKFLTISSLDIQDLQSSLCSIKAIDEIIKYKVKGSQYYFALKKGLSGHEILNFDDKNNEHAKFFVVHKLLSEQTAEFEYYLDENLSNPPDKQLYQAMVINKTPQLIQDKKRFYQYKKALSNNELYETLESVCPKENAGFKTIPFDSYIQYQLVREYYEDETGTPHSQLLSSIGKTRWLLLSICSDLKHHAYYLNNLSTLESYYNELRKALNESGYGQLANKIDEMWRPATPLLHLQQYTVELGVQYNVIWKYIYSKVNVKQYLNTHHKELSKSIKNISKLDLNKEFLQKWCFYTELVCYYILCYCPSRNKDNQIIEFQTVKSIENYLVRIIKDQQINLSWYYQRTLEHSSFFPIMNYRFSNDETLNSLNGVFYFALERFFYLKDDFDVLLDGIKLIVEREETDNKQFLDYSSEILNAYIVERNGAKKDILDLLEKKREELNKMTFFQDILCDILKRWRLYIKI